MLHRNPNNNATISLFMVSDASSQETLKEMHSAESH